LGFIYTPTLFPAAAGLTPYRDQIGKRPPIATLELMWCPYAGDTHLIFGYVHPPTEQMALIAATLQAGKELDRIFLHHYDYGLSNVNSPLVSTPELMKDFATVLDGKPSDLFDSVLWNAGFYLWHCGGAIDMKSGMQLAQDLLTSGAVSKQLEKITAAVMK
jgi:anthranilate phosphoribosyltransferase